MRYKLQEKLGEESAEPRKAGGVPTPARGLSLMQSNTIRKCTSRYTSLRKVKTELKVFKDGKHSGDARF